MFKAVNTMEWTSILVAVITALGSFLGVYYANKKSSEKTKALLEYRLNQLENKMDKHNQVIERVYRLEEQQAVTDEKIRVANHRIDDLEQKKGA